MIRHGLTVAACLLMVSLVDSVQVQAEEISGSLEILSNIEEDMMQEYLDAFCKKYPAVEIQYQYYTDYENEVKARLESGDYGDVLFVPGYVNTMDCTKYFMPLGTFEELSEKYHYMESSKYVEQTVYGIPSSAYLAGIIYNKDVFYQAGISQLPKSTEEFYQALENIKERTDAIPFYTNYAADWPLQFWERFPYIEMTGNSDYAGNVFVNIKNPFSAGSTHYQVYGLLYDIVQGGLSESNPMMSDWEISKKWLNEGKIGCMAIGSWAVSQCKEAGSNGDAVAFMPFPNEIDGRQYMSIFTDYCYAISKNSQNKAVAKAYIDFMLDESGYALNHETLSIVKTDPYPNSYGNMENVILLMNNPATGENYDKKLKLTSKLNLEDNSETKRIIEAALQLRDESFDDIMTDWNKRWESSRTPDMEVSETQVNALQESMIADNYEVKFSQTEQQFIEEKKTIRVGYTKDMIPFQQEKEQQFYGVAQEICQIVEENTGLEMEYLSYDNTEQMIKALKIGEIEMIAGIDKNAGYHKQILFSKEYLSYLNVLVQNETIHFDTLMTAKVASVIGEPSAYVDASNIENTPYNTYAEALKAVDNHTQDYVVMNYYSADYYIQEQNCKKVSMLPLSEMSGLCFAFAKDVDTRLVSICNKCIYGISDGNVQVILREYMEQPQKAVTLKRFVEDNPFTALMVVSAIFSLVVAAIVLVMLEKARSAQKHAVDVKRYEILASIVDEYIFEYDYNKKVFFLDEKLQKMFGIEKEIHYDSYQRDNKNFETVLEQYKKAKKREEEVTQPFQMTDVNGETKWYKLIWHVVYDGSQKPQHVIGKLINVQKEIIEMQQMENKAYRDPLTGIYNREGFQNRLEAVYEEIEQKLPITVTVMDFDSFKAVNDTLGHAGGDEALKLLANTLSEVFDRNAIVSRYGGDEFMVCIYETEEKRVHELLGKLIKAMDRMFTYQGITHKISISVGAVFVKEPVSFEALYKEADEALYYTKNHGKNGYHLIQHTREN